MRLILSAAYAIALIGGAPTEAVITVHELSNKPAQGRFARFYAWITRTVQNEPAPAFPKKADLTAAADQLHETVVGLESATALLEGAVAFGGVSFLVDKVFVIPDMSSILDTAGLNDSVNTAVFDAIELCNKSKAKASEASENFKQYFEDEDEDKHEDDVDPALFTTALDLTKAAVTALEIAENGLRGQDAQSDLGYALDSLNAGLNAAAQTFLDKKRAFAQSFKKATAHSSALESAAKAVLNNSPKAQDLFDEALSTASLSDDANNLNEAHSQLLKLLQFQKDEEKQTLAANKLATEKAEGEKKLAAVRSADLKLDEALSALATPPAEDQGQLKINVDDARLALFQAKAKLTPKLLAQYEDAKATKCADGDKSVPLISQPEPADKEVSAAGTASAETSNKEDKDNKKMIGGIIGAVVLLVGGAAAFLYFKQSSA